MRGALALAVAVAVADLSGAEHAFWVVLGTLSVLRTSAAATGATALRALLGTAVGFAIGAALVLLIGSTSTALWVALPIAVAIAAYAPGVAPFAVGQAAFTITIIVLFNLLVPVGWKVGELRIEDVALGCLVSVLVGGVFWPHGVASVVADDLADAYRSGVAYLRQAVDWVCGRARQPARRRALPPSPRACASTKRCARSSSSRAPSTSRSGSCGGSWAARCACVSPRTPSPRCRASARVRPRTCTPASASACACSTPGTGGWPRSSAGSAGHPPAALAPPSPPHADAQTPRSEEGVWLREYLDHLLEHLDELAGPAAHVASYRERPWWR